MLRTAAKNGHVFIFLYSGISVLTAKSWQTVSKVGISVGELCSVVLNLTKHRDRPRWVFWR